MIHKYEDAVLIKKHGVSMRIYNSIIDCPEVAIALQETDVGHRQEFYHEKSTFIYYIIEGKGTWYIEGKPYQVKAGDVVIVPPRKRFYFTGTLKQLCITTPAWQEKFEHHVRIVDLE